MKNLSDAQKIIAQGNREETKEERLQRLEEEERAEIKQAEGAKKSPYFNFLQVNQANYKAEDWLMRESPPAYRLLRFIAQNMDNYNALMCSYKVFQESLGYGRATIARAVKLLKEKNFIRIAKSGTANIYLVNKQLYWHSYGTNYARAEFGAKIIVTADEQEPEDRKQIEFDVKRQKILDVKETTCVEEEPNLFANEQLQAI